MQETTVGVHAKLTKDGAKEVDLLVHSCFFGRPSPCRVLVDWVEQSVTGGSIESLEQMFQYQVAKFPGYVVQDRSAIVMANAEPEEVAQNTDTADPFNLDPKRQIKFEDE
jgi:hypothetical protein